LNTTGERRASKFTPTQRELIVSYRFRNRAVLVPSLIVVATTIGAAGAAAATVKQRQAQVPSPAVTIEVIADGAAPFSPTDGAGQDSAANNGRVRAGDPVTVRVTVAGAGDVSVTTDGRLGWSEPAAPGCVTETNTVTCAGSESGSGPVVYALAATASPAATAGDATTAITATSGAEHATASVVVTAAAPDLVASLTAPSFTGRTTYLGVQGVLVTYGVHLTKAATTAAVSDAKASFGFELDTSAIPGATVVGCSANGAPDGYAVSSAAASDLRTVADVPATGRVVAGGAWSCTAGTARVTVTGATTNPASAPSTAWDGMPLPADRSVASAGAVQLFVPLSTIGDAGFDAVVAVGAVEGSVTGVANASRVVAPGAQRHDTLTATGIGNVEAKVALTQTVNGTAATTEPGPLVAAGAPLVWVHTVSNTGNVALSAVTVVDAQGRHGEPVIANGSRSGDLDGDGVLDSGEVWAFAIEGTQPAGTIEHVATVSSQSAADGSTVAATAVAYSTAVPAAEVPAVTAGPAAVTPESPAAAAPGAGAPGSVVALGAADNKVALKVFINEQEFTATPGPVAVQSETNAIRYEVTNNSAETVSAIEVLNDKVDNDAANIDCGGTPKNVIASLAAGARKSCTTMIEPNAPGTVTFTASTTVGGVADASVSAGYQVKPASIDLELTVNGQDADAAPGITVTPNQILTLAYAVRNTGQVDLADILVHHPEDDTGAFDEIACVSINGDPAVDESIELLHPGQSVNCTLTLRATAGQFSTTASADGDAATDTGTPLEVDGEPIVISDSDAMVYTATGGTTTTTSTVAPTSTIGQGGTNSEYVTWWAAGVFGAGFGLWVLTKRRRRIY
jgi:hypothetical protein